MEKKKKVLTLTFIQTKEFTANNHLMPIREDETLKSKLAFGFGASDQDTKAVECMIKYELLSKDSPFITLEVLCGFEIDPNALKTVYRNEGKIVTIPKKLAIRLANIVVDTARGILFAKTKGTSLSQYLIPMTDASERIIEDIWLPPHQLIN